MPVQIPALLAMLTVGLFSLSGSAVAVREVVRRAPSPRLQRLLGAETVPAGLGVNVHAEAGQAAELRRIAGFGFRLVRTDLLWAEVERAPGVFEWGRYDAFVAEARRVGLTPLLILAYSNPLYTAAAGPEETTRSRAFAPPRDGEARAAFMRFARAAASRFGPDVIWEIWNEPDLNFGRPVDIEAYVDFAMEACRTVRAASPEAPVIGPAASGFAWALLRRFAAADASACFDAVSVHPYRDRVPDDVLADWSAVARLGCVRPRPCPGPVSSEWGYSSWNARWTAARQADYVPRLYLLNLLAGVPVTILYDWRDDADLPSEKEANFGLVNHAGDPKPVHDALLAIVQGLRGLTFMGRIASIAPGAMVLAFGRGGRPTALVGWSDASAEVTIPAAACFERPSERAGCSLKPQLLPVSVAMRLSSRPSVVEIPR